MELNRTSRKAMALTAILLATSLPLLTGCEREGPAERAGKQIDRGVENAGDSIDRATDRVRDNTGR